MVSNTCICRTHDLTFLPQLEVILYSEKNARLQEKQSREIEEKKVMNLIVYDDVSFLSIQLQKQRLQVLKCKHKIKMIVGDRMPLDGIACMVS